MDKHLSECPASDGEECILDEQIKTLKSMICLDKSNTLNRNRICERLRTMLLPKFRASLHQFGSSANCLGFKGCDLDVYVDIPGSVMLLI